MDQAPRVRCLPERLEALWEAWVQASPNVIVEAAKAVPAEILERDPETPWGEFTAMGDVLGHNYHLIDAAEVHRTVEEDLAQLERAVHRLIAA